MDAKTAASRLRGIWWPLIAVLPAAAIFAPAIGFDFVYDDRAQVVNTTQLQTWRNIPSFFTGHVWSWLMPASVGNYYRPGFKLWLYANFTLFERDAPGWHLTTLAGHLLAIYLVYRLALLLMDPLDGRSRGIAAFAAALFGVHPVHLGNVAPISGVADVLVTIYWITAIFCYRRARESVGWPYFLWNAAAVALYAVSVFTKEVGIVLPAILVVYEWMFGAREADKLPQAERDRAGIPDGARPADAARIALGMLPYVAVLAFYFAVRVRVIHGITVVLTPIPMGRLILTWPSMLLFYLKHLVWPLHLGLFYAQPIATRADYQLYAIPAAILALIAMVLWPAARRSRPIQFGLVWIALTLAPVFYLRGMVLGDFTSDRYLYIPSIGFCLVIAELLRLLVPPGYARVAVAAALVGLFAAATFTQEFAWESNDSLYARAVEISPDSAAANRGMGLALSSRGASAAALDYYRRAVELDPRDGDANFGLGFAYYSLAMLPEADSAFVRAIRFEPYDPKAFLYLGLTRMRSGRLSDAQILIAEALRRRARDNPGGYHAAMGEVLERMGNSTGALAEYHAELKESPDSDFARRRITAIESTSGH